METIAYFSGVIENTRKGHRLSFHIILRIHTSPIFSDSSPCNGDRFQVHWHYPFHRYLLSEVQLLVSSQEADWRCTTGTRDSCLSSWNGSF